MLELIEGLKEMAKLEEARVKGFGYTPEELVKRAKELAKKILKNCKKFEEENKDN